MILTTNTLEEMIERLGETTKLNDKSVLFTYAENLIYTIGEICTTVPFTADTFVREVEIAEFATEENPEGKTKQYFKLRDYVLDKRFTMFCKPRAVLLTGDRLNEINIADNSSYVDFDTQSIFLKPDDFKRAQEYVLGAIGAGRPVFDTNMEKETQAITFSQAAICYYDSRNKNLIRYSGTNIKLPTIFVGEWFDLTFNSNYSQGSISEADFTREFADSFVHKISKYNGQSKNFKNEAKSNNKFKPGRAPKAKEVAPDAPETDAAIEETESKEQ